MESSRLARIVESGTTACYGIEWRMSKDGVLVAHELHHPGWRTEYAYKVVFQMRIGGGRDVSNNMPHRLT